MKYLIIYNENNKDNKDNDLTIYDFGNIKGFLSDNNFTMYKIIERNDSGELCELFNGNIPFHVFSIETYNYIPYTITMIEEEEQKKQTQQQIQPLVNQPPLSQQQRQPQYFQKQQRPHRLQEEQKQLQIQQQGERQQLSLQSQQRSQQNMRNNWRQREEVINEKYKKIQPEVSYSQLPLDLPNAVQPHQKQWMSLEEVMRCYLIPLPVIDQVTHSQPVVKDQTTAVLSVKKEKHSLRVRRPLQQPVIQRQETTC